MYSKLKTKIEPNYNAVSRTATRMIAREILTKKDPVLGLPTGETPKGIYELLVNCYEYGLLDFSRAKTFNLDEYYPISPDHRKSFARYMEKRLFGKVNTRENNVTVPDGSIPLKKIEAYCESYEEKISAAGGMDLLILGIGKNGHIGFNEPGTDFGSRTRLVELTERTKKENFDDPDTAPDRAITMGIRTIMNAKRIVLLATGEEKSGSVRKALTGPVTEEWPASILQLHPNATFVLDREAGKEIRSQ